MDIADHSNAPALTADAVGPSRRVRRGRGAVSNRVGRYEPEARERVADGWSPEDDEPRLATTVLRDASRTIITYNTSPDLPFDRSINPYKGCEHGCSYCFARPTHAFLGLSPGLDFETKLFYKPDASRLLEKELRHPGYRCQTIAMGTNTDPYQPIERSHQVTRSILAVLDAFNHPLGMVTKSHLVTRDIDILAAMAERGLVKVVLSVTTLDSDLARRMEPRAAAPHLRLKAIRALSENGIPVGVMVAPIVPALNEPELEAILAAARDAGASEAGYILLRMPLEIKDLFREWLQENFPDRADRVIAKMREMRGGRDYDATFGLRMTGTGPVAQLIRQRFRRATRQLGFNDVPLRVDTTQFRPPPAAGDQLSLL
jgi:DNA repair photolyase